MTGFPMFEWLPDEGRWKASHNPFSAPEPEDEADFEDRPGEARARQYDLVLNGNEVGGGSIRNHRAEVQGGSSTMLGMTEEEAEAKFSFLLRALWMGRRRTAGSPSASTGWRCCSRARSRCAT